MADKIDEIMESGHLRKLDHIGEAVPVLELFTNIWGAGAKTAQLWYQQVKLTSSTENMSLRNNLTRLNVFKGFRTLEDIRTKAHLSSTQKIGLKHYDDFLDRMPREEAAAIEKVVKCLLTQRFLKRGLNKWTVQGQIQPTTGGKGF